MRHRLAHRVGRSSQATTAAVDKSPRRLTHKNSDTPESMITTAEFSPFTSAVNVCGAVAVLSVSGETGPPSPTLKASVTRYRLAKPDFGTDGSAILSLKALEGTDLGLPVLVRQFTRAVNPSVAPGVSGTFGATWAGRTSKAGILP